MFKRIKEYYKEKSWKKFNKKLFKKGWKNFDLSEYMEDRDILHWLLAKLTSMGTWYFNFGICTDNREIAHEIWVARKLLLKAINAEDDFEAEILKKVEDKYGFKCELEIYDKQTFIETGCLKEGPDFHLGVNPINCLIPDKYKTKKQIRESAVRLAEELDEELMHLRFNTDYDKNQPQHPYKNCCCYAERARYNALMKFFSYLALKIDNWWD